MVCSSFCRQCLVSGPFFALQSNIHAFCLRVVLACTVDIASAWLNSPCGKLRWHTYNCINLYIYYMCIHGVSSSGHHWVIIGSLLGHHLVMVGSSWGHRWVIAESSLMGSSLGHRWVIAESSLGHRSIIVWPSPRGWVIVGSSLGPHWVIVGS